MKAGKVYHLRTAPGPADFEAELVSFPNGEHDDQIDAAVYGSDLGAPGPTAENRAHILQARRIRVADLRRQR